MRITGWKAGEGIENRKFSFLSTSSVNSDGWITMVVGRNGTKKSLLLRALLDAFLGYSDFRHGIRPAIPTAVEFDVADPVKGRAIAVSGTPFDRFPRQNRYIAQTIAGRYDNASNYFYLGLSSANGAIGTTHGVRTLAHLLFRAARSDSGLASAVMGVLDFLDFRNDVYVVFKRSAQINFSKKEASESSKIVAGKFSLANFEQQLELRITGGVHKGPARGLRNIVEKMRKDTYREKLISSLEKLPGSIVFRFNDEGMHLILHPKVEMHITDIIALLEAGLLTASHIGCEPKLSKSSNLSSADNPNQSDPGKSKKSPKVLADTDMSSGQWQVLSSMLGLALTVTNNSLVVIDEPENSLHPEWQRSYVQLLGEVIAHREGCHAVIATHSPLIASGVDGKNGNAIRMMRKPTDSLLGDSERLRIAFGWDASDVYHEIFGLSAPRASRFTESADRALTLLRGGLVNSDELEVLINELAEVAEFFPETDSMRQVVSAMEQAYKAMSAR